MAGQLTPAEIPPHLRIWSTQVQALETIAAAGARVTLLVDLKGGLWARPWVAQDDETIKQQVGGRR
jgi:hypothetical protein